MEFSFYILWFTLHLGITSGITKPLQMGIENAVAINTLTHSLSTGRIIESDIALNRDYTYCDGNSTTDFDYQGVFTHELGHTFGLDDLEIYSGPINAIQTMYANSTYNWYPVYYYFRDLDQDDKTGKAMVASLCGF